MLARTLLACATFVVAAVAQSTMIAFTNPPANITAGKSVDLTWAGGDGSPVTLTLQQGLPSDLQTVLLVTGSATGTSYTWNVPSSLPDASNYAFKIQQGDNPPNYTGMITLTGGSTTGPTLAVSALASSSSTSTSASVSATSTVGTNPASGGVVGGGSSNGTSSSGNATTTAPAAVGTGASGSAATGTALSRNTTMSHATLTSSSSSSSSAAATSSSSSTGTSTSSSPSPSSSKTSAAITLATSNFALLCAAVVGIAYLG
ncbi:hypothetical protein JMJ35_006718 [Cladonia borealis]|uniref:Yeast cell wall synthesis Kre9/Knh1-like N-terminal domain-containing protein n=1 Tax=Cladonia borealis TaxID=184061 RepID=A0AA39U9A2_9LECA|nr:hypothetical protein JMJ35_006718 [Cladonia borealis]